MYKRQQLLPGAKEEWRLKITGPKGEKVAAQLLAGMYDASLDHFVPHDWDMDIWQGNYPRLGWDRMEPFGMVVGHEIMELQAEIERVISSLDSVRTYPSLRTRLGGWGFVAGGGAGMALYRSFDGDALQSLEAGNAVYFSAPLVDESAVSKPGAKLSLIHI